jgi:ABC-type multidrug transport system fused ATPase/permease subunit
LARFYDYEDGEIWLGGHDLRSYTQEGARAAVAVMEQRPALFNTTLRENIRIGCPDASDADVEEAAPPRRDSQLHHTAAAGL